MCDLLCEHYRGRHGCGHMYVYGVQRCSTSFMRPDQARCVPPSGRLRDLPRVVDVEDDYKDGQCRVCLGQTPPSSEGSELGWVI